MKSSTPLFPLAFLIGTLFTPVMAGNPSQGLPKIALGSLGKEDFGEYFRLLLEEELIKKGFKVVSPNDHPEGTLSGIIVRWNFPDSSARYGAEGIVRLTLPDGRVIWSGGPWWNGEARKQATQLVDDFIDAIQKQKLFTPQIVPGESK